MAKETNPKGGRVYGVLFDRGNVELQEETESQTELMEEHFV